MKAVLLAAGAGSRLGAITQETPKILVDVNGEPLLSRQLRYLEGEGVTGVFVNAHHHAPKVAKAVSAWKSASLDAKVYVEETLQGTAGALAPMRDELPSRFVVMNGDTLTNVRLAPMLAKLGAGLDVVMAIHQVSDTRGKGVADIVGGQIVRFSEKPRPEQGGFVNGGVYAMNECVLDRCRPGADLAEDVFPQLAADGRIVAHFTTASFLDVGTPESLATAQSW